jgi:hypothetical protein
MEATKTMELRHVTAALLALLVVGAGAAAATPGQAPEKAQDSDHRTGHEGPPADAGPPVDLPSQVPDFVSGIHEQINGFLDGTVENLGEAISGLTPGEGGPPGDAGSDGDDA